MESTETPHNLDLNTTLQAELETILKRIFFFHVCFNLI